MTFAVENTRWQIDLTRTERDAFVRALAPYTEKARRVRGDVPGGAMNAATR
ncbi:Lsr2 dimerization domain-containing protein [Cognatiluteimonas profundi]|uniref:Lsr2 dimerization domain-containing protein n=1 Tax=Cognatiluteimonas profundi TaxID=2594501 RepID=UPI003CCD6135